VIRCHNRNTLKDKLLVNDELTEQNCEVERQKDVIIKRFKNVVLPYSVRNELRYFFGKGIPLCLSAFMKWGAPPWFAMIMAGHTQESDSFQSALGYGRVFYNCTSLMILIGAINYFKTVLPGCIGAGRKDRIPSYLRRSLLLVTMFMIPCLVLQLFAEQILFQLGVPSHNC